VLYIITIILGVFAGFLSGFFGIGGGIIFVPTLLFILQGQGYEPGNAMLIASGSSLGAIVFSTLSSFTRHRVMGNVRTEAIIPAIFGVVIGSALGVIITNIIGGDPLRYILAGFNVWAAYRICKHIFPRKQDSKKRPKTFYNSVSEMPWTVKLLFFLLGVMVGAQSSMLGIGGGAFVVAFLVVVFRYPSSSAAGTSTFIAFSDAVVSVIFRGILGNTPPRVPTGTIGTTNIILAILMGIPAIFGAQLGALFHKKVGENKLFYISFGILLLIVAVKMIF